MKIGIDIRMFSDSFTGIGRYNYELTKRYFIKYPNINWVLFMNDPEYSNFTFPSNVQKICVNAKHYSLKEQTKFLQCLLLANCDIVHFTHFNVPYFYRKPYIVTIHDTLISYYPGKKMNNWWCLAAYNLIIKNAITQSKKVIAVTNNTKQDILKLFHPPEKKIQVVYNGVSDEFIPQTEKIKQIIKNKYNLKNPFLLYTGNWREHKNLVKLLLAFKLIISSYPNLELVITGKNDPYYPEVQQTISKLSLTNKIKQVGLVSLTDLVTLYDLAQIYVFPSLYEGFGMPPLEAMRVNTPTCVSKIASLPEVCENATHYFDPHNSKDIAQKLLEILKNTSLQKELIAKGQKQSQKFSWDKTAEQTLQIILQN